MSAKDSKLKRICIAAASAAFALTLAVSVSAAPTAGEVSVSGANKEVGGTTYYTGSVTLSVNASSEEGLKKATLSINGQNMGSKDLEGTEAPVSFEVTGDKLAQMEPSNYKYEAVIKIEDNAGQSKNADKTFYADASEAEVSITGVENGASYNTSKKPKVTMSDKNIGNDTAKIVIKKNGETVKTVTDVNECKSYDSYTASGDGKYKVEAELAGKAQSASAAVEFTVDKEDPTLSDISLTGTKKEGHDWYCSAVGSSLTAEDGLSGLDRAEVFLDGSRAGNAELSDNTFSFTVTESMIREGGGSDGMFTLRYDVYDKAGNKASKTTTFRAAMLAPEVLLSGISDGAFTNTKPTITATSEKPAKTASVLLKIKRNGSEYDTKEGESSVSYSPDQDGLYELTASLTDKAGNVSEEKTLTFTLDTSAPEKAASEISGPLRTGYEWYYDHVDLTADFTDGLSGLDSCSITVNGTTAASKDSLGGKKEESLEVSLDKQWFTDNKSEDGKYTVTYKAKDRAGNSYSGSAEFYADVEEPDVTISGIENGSYTNKKVEIKAEVKDNYPDLNEITFTVTRNGQPYKEYKKAGEKASFSNFDKDGRYTIYVKTVDKAGNESKVRELSFTRDTVAPEISISGAKKNSYTTGAKKLKAHIKELNYSNMTVGGDITRTLDGKKKNIGWGSIKPTSADYTHVKKVNGTGTYKVTLTAVDKAGNRATPKSLTFTIDNDKPIVKITNVKDLSGYSDTVSPKASWEDSYFASRKVTLTRVTGKSTDGLGARETKNKKGGAKTYANFIRQKKYDDVYTLTVTCMDKAGNKATATKTFIVCRFGSRFKLHDAGYNGKYVKNVDSNITITERTPAGLTSEKGILSLDGRQLDTDVKVSESRSGGWNVYTYTFPASDFAEEGVYTLDTSSMDTAGNVSQFAENKDCTIYVDRTPPVISFTGIDSSSQYRLEDAKGKLSITDNIRAASYAISSNGKVFRESSGKDFSPTATVQLPGGMGQTITIAARDAAGNVGKYELTGVTVSDNLFMRLIANRTFDIFLGAAILAAAAGIFFLMRRRRKDDEETSQTE